MKKTALTLFLSLVCSQVSAIELKVIVPDDGNIQVDGGPSSPYVLESKNWGESTKQQKVFVRDKGNGDLAVHRRVDNGVAGSGKVFQVRLEINTVATGKELIFRTTDALPEEYREGLFGRFPVPSFTDEDLLAYLASGHVRYIVEVDSDFPVDSIKANFERLANGHVTRGGAQVGDILVDNTRMTFRYRVVPYRNGSKAIIEATLRQEHPDNGVVDFRNIVGPFNEAVTKVVSS